MNIEARGIGIGVDWVTCVFTDNTLSSGSVDNQTKNKRAKDIIKHLFRETPIIIDGASTGRYGYQYAVSLGYGGYAMWSGHTPEMGMCLVLPGKVWNVIRSTGKDHIKRILLEMVVQQVKVSRFDVAIDFTGMFTISDFAQDARTGFSNKSRIVRVWETVQGGKGKTYYVGTRNSKRFVRVYDKAAQKGIEGVTWVRFEIECSKPVAQQYLYAVARGCMNDVVNDIAKRYPIEHCAVWESINACPCKMLTVEHITDTKAWVQSIMKAIAKGAMLWGVKDFTEALNYNLDEQGCAEMIGVLPVD